MQRYRAILTDRKTFFYLYFRVVFYVNSNFFFHQDIKLDPFYHTNTSFIKILCFLIDLLYIHTLHFTYGCAPNSSAVGLIENRRVRRNVGGVRPPPRFLDFATCLMYRTGGQMETKNPLIRSLT